MQEGEHIGLIPLSFGIEFGYHDRVMQMLTGFAEWMKC